MRFVVPRVAWAVIVAALVAGCSGQSPVVDLSDLEADVPEGGPVAGFDTIPRPAWNVSDWWTYDIQIARDFGGLPWSTELSPTIVVVGVDARDGYWTTVTTREDAVTRFHWGDVWGGNHTPDLDPRVPLDAADGTRSERAADLFAWPMTLNKTWKGSVQFAYGGATIEGLLDFQVVSLENASVLTGTDLVATVVGTGHLTTSAAPEPEPYTLTYQFARGTKNVVSLSIANETLTPLSMTLTDHGANYTGEAVLLGVENLYFGLKIVAPGATNAATAPHPESFEQDRGYDFMDVFFGMGLFSQGRVSVTVADPAGGTEGASHDSTSQAFFEAREHASAPGTWTVSYEQAALSFAAVGVSGVDETVVTFVDGTPAEPA